MKPKIIIAILLITLTACSSAQPSADVANTAMSIVQTGVALTQTAMPTVTPPSPTFTPTATVVYPTPSPMPTFPPAPILTPDAIQVERWKEYQTELAKAIFPHDPPEWFPCEWDILGRSGQEVYVWAVCGVGERSGSSPAVIHLNVDGSVLNAEIPWNWSVENMHKMFPEDVRNKFDYMYAGEIQKMSDHLELRGTNPEVPPLVILSATPTATPTP